MRRNRRKRSKIADIRSISRYIFNQTNFILSKRKIINIKATNLNRLNSPFNVKALMVPKDPL